MKHVLCVIEDVENELNVAKHYVNMAIEYPKYVNEYKTMAKQELEHVQINHDIVSKLIAEYKAAKGDPPEHMMIIWEYEHEKFIKCANSIKYQLSLL